MRRTTQVWLTGCVGLAISGCAASDAGPSGRLGVAIARLELAGVDDACYTISVSNGLSLPVWSESFVCGHQYGSSGAVSYVGTCDASPGAASNTVSLVLEQICSGGDCQNPVSTPPAIAGAEWVNPCPADDPCSLTTTCRENEDVEVEFNITVMRSADQGFFDIGVNFADVFCSAKVDCAYCRGEGQQRTCEEINLLHDAEGERNATVVMAFACTAGSEEGGAAPTTLHMNDVVLKCPSRADQTIDPAPAELGNQIRPPAPPPSPLYQVLVTDGVETLPGYSKLFWTVSFGVNLPAAVGCTIETSFTASQGPNGLDWELPGHSYPVIDVAIPIGRDVVSGDVTCGGDNTNALDSSSVIVTDYRDGSDREVYETFDNCANDEGGEVVFCAPPPPPSVPYEIANTVTLSSGGQSFGGASAVSAIGQSFAVTQAFTANTVGMAVGNPFGNSGSYVLQLFAADASGRPTGSLLGSTASIPSSALLVDQPWNSPIVEAPLSAGVALAAGTSYVLVAQIVTGGHFFASWDQNQPFTGGIASIYQQGVWYFQYRDTRFRVSGMSP